MKANQCYFRSRYMAKLSHRGIIRHKNIIRFLRKYLTQGRVWNSCVLRCRVTKEANPCYFRSRFLACVSYSGIGTHLHEVEPMLF